MRWKLCWLLFLVILHTILGVEELPLCPTNISFFPQSLPMHCRMVDGIKTEDESSPDKKSNSKREVTFPPSIFQSPPPNKNPPMPFPVPPGFPGPIFPPGMPVPPMAAIPPVPIPIAGPPPQKLPVIVMPFYSPDPAFSKKKDKKSKEKHKDSDSESCSDDTDDSDSESGNTSGRYWKPGKYGKKSRKKSKRSRGRKKSYRRSGGGYSRRQGNDELLTPLIQYVTNDGYVIYEKEISKGEARAWLTKRDQETEKGVSFAELDEIKEEIGEDNHVFGNVEETKSVKTQSEDKQPDATVTVPTPTPTIVRKKFQKVHNDPEKLLNRIRIKMKHNNKGKQEK